MEARVNVAKVGGNAFKAMFGLQQYVEKSGLDHKLLHLVKMRASQINGCAYCLKMHSRDARKEGESEERLYLLDAWREAPIYTARERAALAWTEAVTLVSETQVPDAEFEAARAEFSEQELIDLTMAVVAINGWNRLSIAFRAMPEVEGRISDADAKQRKTA